VPAACVSRKHVSFFRSTVFSWFEKNGRSFKWRKESDPFRILIAEIMLQRTRAEQVEPVYTEFTNKFKNLRSLGQSQIEEISPFVGKLGLSRRSKIFIEMANYIMSKYNGEIPSSKEELLNIPGIGDDIANAMIVFAFGGRGFAIDSNVVRLISRFFGVSIRGEGRRDKTLVEFCHSLPRDRDPKSLKKLNWALIDFPALLCKIKPLCNDCPLATKCAYFKKEINSASILN